MTTSPPLSLRLYAAAMRALGPAVRGVLHTRARAGKEDKERLGERLGRTEAARPDGPLVWLHGVSLGESLSLLPLIDRIRAARPNDTILVTTGTVTSAELLARRLPPGVIHQYAPVDTPAAVSAFLDHWRPDVGLFAESELWPNLLGQAKARGVRLALVSARLTAKAARGWARRPVAARTLLGAFDFVLPQDKESAARLESLGAKLGPALNLKRVGEPLPFAVAALIALKKAVGERPVVLAASTHPSEETFVADAFQALPVLDPRPLLVVAPRHPQRGESVTGILRARGLAVARRSLDEAITEKTQAYVADTLGEMGVLYRLAAETSGVAIVGGGFAPGVGGHNPLEPARLGAPIISGSHVFNFKDIYADLTDGVAGALIAEDETDLKTKIHTLLTQKPIAASMTRRASAYADEQTTAFEAGWSLIEPLLPKTPA